MPSSGRSESAGRSSGARRCPPGRASSTVRPRAPEPPGSFLAAGLHLGALSAFALAQPLLDLLGHNVEFFAVRGSNRWDLLAFALGLILVPPLLLLGLEALAGTVHPRAATGLHLLLVALLAALFF